MRILYASAYSVHDQKRVYYLRRHHYVRTLTFRSYGLNAPLFNVIQKADWYYPLKTLPNVVKGGASLIIFKHVFLTEKPDVVHACWIPSYPFLSYLTRVKPLVAQVLASEMIKYDLFNPIIRLQIKKTLEYANAIIVDSEYVKNKALRLIKDDDKMFLVPVGVDTSLFKRNEETRRRIRMNLGVADDEVLIICNRWHTPIYGVENLIRAIPQVTANVKKIKFLLLEGGSLSNYYRKLIEALEVSSHVLFLSGPIPNNEMSNYLVASDLYMSPSLSDGTSVSLLEAMACELPVIVIDLPAIREWVSTEQNGLLVKRSQPSLIAKGIIGMISRRSEWKRIGQRNRSVIKKRADMNTLVPKLTEIYNYAIGKS